MNVLKEKIFKYIDLITIIIFVCSIIFFADFFKNLSAFDLDDLNSTYDSHPILSEENGRYVCNFLSRIFCLYIPKLFNIHLQDAANTIGLVLFILIILITAVACASFVYIKYKNKLLFNILLVGAFLHFVYYIYICPVFYFTIFSFQYGYVLATFFGLIFLYFLLNYFLNSQFSLNKKQFILFIIIAFCAGNSTHIVTYFSSVTIVLFYLYTFIEQKFDIEKSKKILFNRNIIIPVISFILGALLMVTCRGFWNEFSWRHAESLSQIFDIFIPFSKAYIDVVFVERIIYYKVLILLLICILIKDFILKKDIKKSLKTVLYSGTPLIGIWLYYFSVIVLGPSFPIDDFKYWVYEPFYKLPYLMTLFAIFCFLLGYLLHDIKKTKIKVTVTVLLCVYIVFFCNMDFLKNVKNVLADKRNEVNDIRKQVYICDKLITKQFYAGGDILIPEYCDKSIYWDTYIQRYYQSFYGIKLDNKIIFADDKSVYDKFYSIGGQLTDEEINAAKFKNITKE